MNYLASRNFFLLSCRPHTAEERERAIELFDKTLIAATARLADAWAEFWEKLRP